ncbi:MULTISPECIES: glycosyltransferase 87 family protein [unclassified Frankia]
MTTGVAAALVVLTVMIAPQPQTDFAVYRLGGQAVWDGPALYQVRTAAGLPFTYPPIAAVLFTPFAAIPLGLAEVVWAALTVAALILLLSRLRAWLIPPTGTARAVGARRALGSRWAPPLLLVVAALATEPVRSTIIFGQVNILLMLAVWLDAGPGRRSTPFTRLPPGALTGLAAAVKLTPLIFVAYLWLAGRRRVAIGAVGTFLAAHAVAFALAPAASRAYWGGVFADPGRIGSVTYAGNQSLYGAMTRIWGDGASVVQIHRLMVAAVAVTGLALAVRLHRRGEPVAGLLACAVTGLLVSPISWSHHWVWAVPTLLWLATNATNGRASHRYVGAALAGYVLFVASPVWWITPHDQNWPHHRDPTILLTNAYVIAGVVLLVTLAHVAGRRDLYRRSWGMRHPDLVRRG